MNRSALPIALLFVALAISSCSKSDEDHKDDVSKVAESFGTGIKEEQQEELEQVIVDKFIKRVDKADEKSLDSFSSGYVMYLQERIAFVYNVSGKIAPKEQNQFRASVRAGKLLLEDDIEGWSDQTFMRIGPRENAHIEISDWRDTRDGTRAANYLRGVVDARAELGPVSNEAFEGTINSYLEVTESLPTHRKEIVEVILGGFDAEMPRIAPIINKCLNQFTGESSDYLKALHEQLEVIPGIEIPTALVRQLMRDSFKSNDWNSAFAHATEFKEREAPNWEEFIVGGYESAIEGWLDTQNAPNVLEKLHGQLELLELVEEIRPTLLSMAEKKLSKSFLDAEAFENGIASANAMGISSSEISTSIVPRLEFGAVGPAKLFRFALEVRDALVRGAILSRIAKAENLNLETVAIVDGAEFTEEQMAAIVGELRKVNFKERAGEFPLPATLEVIVDLENVAVRSIMIENLLAATSPTLEQLKILADLDIEASEREVIAKEANGLILAATGDAANQAADFFRAYQEKLGLEASLVVASMCFEQSLQQENLSGLERDGIALFKYEEARNDANAGKLWTILQKQIDQYYGDDEAWSAQIVKLVKLNASLTPGAVKMIREHLAELTRKTERAPTLEKLCQSIILAELFKADEIAEFVLGRFEALDSPPIENLQIMANHIKLVRNLFVENGPATVLRKSEEKLLAYLDEFSKRENLTHADLRVGYELAAEPAEKDTALLLRLATRTLECTLLEDSNAITEDRERYLRHAGSDAIPPREAARRLFRFEVEGENWVEAKRFLDLLESEQQSLDSYEQETKKGVEAANFALELVAKWKDRMIPYTAFWADQGRIQQLDNYFFITTIDGNSFRGMSRFRVEENTNEIFGKCGLNGLELSFGEAQRGMGGGAVAPRTIYVNPAGLMKDATEIERKSNRRMDLGALDQDGQTRIYHFQDPEDPLDIYVYDIPEGVYFLRSYRKDVQEFRFDWQNPTWFTKHKQALLIHHCAADRVADISWGNLAQDQSIEIRGSAYIFGQSQAYDLHIVGDGINELKRIRLNSQDGEAQAALAFTVPKGIRKLSFYASPVGHRYNVEVYTTGLRAIKTNAASPNP